MFIVSWQKACTCDLSELSTAVIGTTFNIQDLEPDTIYSICVSAVSSSDDQMKSERKCFHTKTLELVCECYSDLPHTVHQCITGRNTQVCTLCVHHAVEWHACVEYIHMYICLEFYTYTYVSSTCPMNVLT